MAQHASPNVIGQMLACLAQFVACSTVVTIRFSSNRPSIHGLVMVSPFRFALESRFLANQ
jgi:hypothetical protein